MEKVLNGWSESFAVWSPHSACPGVGAALLSTFPGWKQNAPFTTLFSDETTEALLTPHQSAHSCQVRSRGSQWTRPNWRSMGQRFCLWCSAAWPGYPLRRFTEEETVSYQNNSGKILQNKTPKQTKNHHEKALLPSETLCLSWKYLEMLILFVKQSSVGSIFSTNTFDYFCSNCR